MRVIKGQGQTEALVPPLKHKWPKTKIIAKEIYQAGLKAAEIRQQATITKKALIIQGKIDAKRKKQEATIEATAQSIAQCFWELRQIFCQRREQAIELENSIVSVSATLVEKILGGCTQIDHEQLRFSIRRHVKEFMIQPPLLVEIAIGRTGYLEQKWPQLGHKLKMLPDIQLSESEDINSGFARLSCGTGSIVYDEKLAMAALANFAQLMENNHELDTGKP